MKGHVVKIINIFIYILCDENYFQLNTFSREREKMSLDSDAIGRNWN